MTPARKLAILGKETSRRNKLHLIADANAHGHHVWTSWAGTPFNSRLRVAFDNGPWMECKSFDEDVLCQYKSGKERK